VIEALKREIQMIFEKNTFIESHNVDLLHSIQLKTESEKKMQVELLEAKRHVLK